jgi:hypothetical protein
MGIDLDLQNYLETLIDENSLSGVLDTLAVIALAKADHIKTNYGTRGKDETAAAWEEAGARIARQGRSTLYTESVKQQWLTI